MIDRSDLHNLFLLGYALLETLNVHSRILSTLDILIFSMRLIIFLATLFLRGK